MDGDQLSSDEGDDESSEASEGGEVRSASPPPPRTKPKSKRRTTPRYRPCHWSAKKTRKAEEGRGRSVVVQKAAFDRSAHGGET